MYAINGVPVRSAYTGRRTGRLGYVFDYSQVPDRSARQAQASADRYASGRVKGRCTITRGGGVFASRNIG